MLPCQRALFDIPADVCYLNAAGYSPLPRAVTEAGHAGVARKGQPWLLDGAFIPAQNERTRAVAAKLIGAEPRDVALISSVGYGVATAGKLLSIPRGSRVIVIADDHSSPVLEWHHRAAAQGFTVETIAIPADGDWTAAILASLGRAGAAPAALVSVSSLHWSDGCMIDLAAVKRALGAGGALLIDFTQSAGVQPLDVATLDPDFVIFPTYKWLLGPYGRAFLYVARRHQGGIPLEQTAHGRVAVRAEQTTYFTDTNYASDARRFDMGERDHFISMEMAAVGIELMLGWGSAAVSERLRWLTDCLAERLVGIPGITVRDRRFRAPHILSLGFPKGMPADLMAQLAREKVFAAPRLGRLRISPHVYNDEADADRLATALRRIMT